MVASKSLIVTPEVARMKPLRFAVCSSADRKREPLLGKVGSVSEVSGE